MRYNDLAKERDRLRVEISKWQKYYNEIRLHRALTTNNGLLLTPKQFLNLYLLY
jgi:transposase InsO family protein